MPNVSYQVVKIRNLPLLLTPLSINLTQQNGNDARSTGPRMGYLTLNQTRKVVPMLECDTASSVSPIVGVWVCLDEPEGGAAFPNTFLNHPFLWGACTRFMQNTNIRDRVYIDTDTFLMANFGSESVSFFEVTKLAAPNRQGRYACCDFSVDLTLDKANHNAMEPVVCKFRPLSQADQIASFREATGDSQGGGTSSDANISPDEMTSEQIRSAARVYIDQAKEQAEAVVEAEGGTDGTWSEGNTPMPRPAAPVRSAPSSPSKPASARLLEVPDAGARLASTGPQPTGTVNGNAASFAALSKSYSEGARYPQAFPAELILAQQMQLDTLREQVARLQEMVLVLSTRDAATGRPAGAVPTSEAGTDPSAPQPPPMPSSSSAPDASQGKDSSEGGSRKESGARDSESSKVDSAAAGGAQDEEEAPGDENDDQNSVMKVVEAVEVSVGSLDEQLKKVRSSYSKVNPLASSAGNHPVLRVHPDEERELMEPSVLKQKGLGEAAFPGPTLDHTLDGQVGEQVDPDVDSDEETLLSLDLLTEEMSSGVGKHFMVPPLEESASMLETESLVAIQAKYA